MGADPCGAHCRRESPTASFAAEPDRFFAPTPSATGAFSNWVAMYLDTTGAAAVDWAEVEAMLEEAYRLIAPRRLVDRLRPQRH